MTQTTRHRVAVAVASALLATMAYPAAVGAIPRSQSMRSPHTATRTWCPSVIVARWSLDRLIEQLIVIPVDQAALPEARAEVAAGVGGIILTGTPPANLKQQIASALKVAPDGIFPFVMTDEEGGAVQRLWPLIGDVPSARTMGATMTSGAIERRAAGLALSMHALGLTMDLAPVADIDARPGPNATNADGTRAFSGNTATTARDALAFARGLEAGGIIPVSKHFPGLGGSVANTDFATAKTPPWSVVEKTGLVPFARAITAGMPAVMVSNAEIPGLSRAPASLSRVVVTNELRGRLHFRGLILTDSLSAPSISHLDSSIGGAVVAALIAGDDMVLFNASTQELSQTTTAIVLAVRSALAKGSISRAQLEQAAATVLRTKRTEHCPGGTRRLTITS